MEVILICIAMATALFVAAFLTKRRFGLLGLALAAGSILSSVWGDDLGMVASGLGIPQGPMTSAIVLAAIIMLPPFVLLFHGYTYKNHLARIAGAIMFTILALAFLIEPLGHILVLTGTGADVYNWLVDNRTLIIGAGLILAVFDLFLTKPVHKLEKKKH
ncbi:MAG: hypothetical protein WCP11_02155 [Candidatus Saccharibacteria bacterium]